MNIEQIRQHVEAAEENLEALKDGSADLAEATELWKRAVMHLAQAEAQANAAKVRDPKSLFVRRIIMAHVERLSDALRVVEL